MTGQVGSENDFYLSIELGVREWVKRLRDAGVNTECSCGHDGYIQCQCLEPEKDVELIKKVLHEHGLWHYEIEWTYNSYGENYAGWHQSITVRSKEFKANLVDRR